MASTGESRSGTGAPNVSLLEAVKRFDVRAVVAAFDAGATLASTTDGVAALHVAAGLWKALDVITFPGEEGSLALLRLLLARGGIAASDAVYSTHVAGLPPKDGWLGNTLLHTASTGYHTGECVEVARFLLGCGVDVNARNAQGDTAVDLAEHESLRDLLKRAGGRYGLHAVYYASRIMEYGDVAALSAALDAGASANEKKTTRRPCFWLPVPGRWSVCACCCHEVHRRAFIPSATTSRLCTFRLQSRLEKKGLIHFNARSCFLKRAPTLVQQA